MRGLDKDKSGIKDLSVVIPVCDEAQNLEILCEEIISVIEKLGFSYEIIFVEDGSKDASFNILCKLKRMFKQVAVIKHKRRYGQSRALSTGIYFSKGKIVITMDSDLQNDPQDIPLFIDKIKEGYDMVCGWRENRKDPYLTKVFPSKAGNRVLSRLSGVKFHDFSCTFKAFQSNAAKKVAQKLHKGFHRFIPLLGKKMNFDICEIKISHKPRIYGISKYRFLKYIEALRSFFILNYIYLDKKKKKKCFIFPAICVFFGFSSLFIKLFLPTAILLSSGAFFLYIIKQGNNLLLPREDINRDIIEKVIN